MSQSWSKQVAERYALTLPPDLRAWLDDGVWQLPGGAEFNQPLTPAELLEPQPDQLWAGFMLPDTLPLIGNQYGDWLCVRATADGRVGEIIGWSHAGGDWTPHGRTLAEALLYDGVFRQMNARRAEFRHEPEPPREEVFRSARWALAWTNGAREKVGEFWLDDRANRDDASLGGHRQELLDALVASSVAEIAARRDLILHHLHCALKSLSDPQLARQIGAAWEPDFISWLFDTAMLPDWSKTALGKHFQQPIVALTQQDWAAAEDLAVEVCRQRSDLGWAFDVAGWAAERRGDFDVAVQRYWLGLRTSLFADNTVAFRTHWFTEGLGKFAAARLAALQAHLNSEQRRDPYLALFLANDPTTLRERVRQHWLTAARAAESRGKWMDAYRAYYNAGWDFGLLEVKSFAEILDGLTRTARAAGATSLSLIAAEHARCLADRLAL
jgi:hypothetical protein